MLVVSWLLLFPVDVVGSIDQRHQWQQRPGEAIRRGARDDVSLTRDLEFIRSKEGPVEERSRPHRPRLTGVVYRERTWDKCGDDGGGCYPRQPPAEEPVALLNPPARPTLPLRAS